MTRRLRWAGLGLLATALALASGWLVRTLTRPDPAGVYERALSALEAGRFAEAEAGMQRLANLREPTVLDWGVRARLAMAAERADEALAALSEIPDDHPLSAWARMRAGQLESRRNRFRVAEGHFRAALAREPGLVEARRALIYILSLQLRRIELDAEFETLAEQAPLTPKEVWVWCMSRDLVWWRPEEHVPILRAALEADPADRRSRLALAEVERRQGNAAEARGLLGALPESDPEARALRATIALEGEDLEAATRLLAEGPADHPELAALRGRLAIGGLDAAEAVRQFAIARAAEPDRRRALFDLGRAWQLAGEPEKAAPYLEAATAIERLDRELLRAETRTEAVDPDLWRRLGAACEAAGRLPEARAWYALILKGDPLDAEAQRALFRLRRESGGIPSPLPESPE